MIKQCNVCGKHFITYPSKIKLGRGKYCSRQCSFTITNITLTKGGEKSRFIKGKSHKWHSHRTYNWSGYVEIYLPKHPFSTKRGYVKEHRILMEKKIGRYLRKDEDVHHINGIKDDNRIENLELLTHSEHTRISNPIVFRWKRDVVF